MQVEMLMQRMLQQLRWRVEVYKQVQWTIDTDGEVALFRLVCQVEPSERMDVEMVGGRICCVWMVLMVSCY